MGFNFAFDDQGRFICTEATCPDIIKALLDHHLDSRLSGHLYDVETPRSLGDGSVSPQLKPSAGVAPQAALQRSPKADFRMEAAKLARLWGHRNGLWSAPRVNLDAVPGRGCRFFF